MFQVEDGVNRRDMMKAFAVLAAGQSLGASALAAVQSTVGASIPVRQRLDQGPFDIEQDEGWRTALFTTPSEKPIRNPALGLVGYTWEENGPSLTVRAGKRSLEDKLEQIAALP